MFPPHLPPPTCDINRHRQWQRLKIILTASVFGLIAGMTGASVILGWVWPGFAEGDAWVRTYSANFASRRLAEERAESRMQDKIFSLYSKASVAPNGGGTLEGNDKIAEAVVVSSNGWLVAYMPVFDGKFKEWRAVGANDVVYTVTKALWDKRAHLVFFKISRVQQNAVPLEQFKSAVFEGSLDRFDDVFVYDGGVWTPSFVVGSRGSREKIDSSLDTTPRAAAVLSGEFADGSVVVDVQGNAVGFTTGGRTVLPLASIGAVLGLNDLESAVEISYPTFGLEGWYDSEKVIIVDGETQKGFFVQRVLGNKSLFRRGDILRTVNGKPVSADTMLQFVRAGQAQFNVLRGGNVISVNATSTQL